MSKKGSALEALPRPSKHTLLSMVPSPTRSPKSGTGELSTSLESPTTSNRVGNTETNAFLLPSHGSSGPEPWGLPDPLQPPTPQHGAKAGYREWLQARGQMAMQRSLGGTAGRPPLPSTATGQASSVPPTLPLAAVTPGPTLPVSCSPWGGMQGDVQLQWYGAPTASPEMSPCTPGAGSAPLGFGVCNQTQLMLPACSQTSVAFGCLQQSPMTPVGGGMQGAPVYNQQTPVASSMACSSPMASHMAFGGCLPPTPVRATSIAAQNEVLLQTATENDEQEQLMAAVMPEGFSGLDKETIAQQLRAAAACTYED